MKVTLVKLISNYLNFWQKSFFIFASLILCFYNITKAQTSLDFQQFTQEDGLASNYVFTLHQDHLGFIWIGTENGLNRFDGKYFLHFKHDPEDPQTLDDNWILSLYEDSKNHLWIGTERGVNRLNRETGKVERVPLLKYGKKVQDPIGRFCEDNQGNLWIGSGKEGLFQVKGSPREGNKWIAEYFHYEDSLSDNHEAKKRNRLVFAKDDELWLNNSGALKSLHIPSKKLTYYHPSNPDNPKKSKVDIIKCVYLGDGTILIHTPKNLFTLDASSETPQITPLQSIDIPIRDDISIKDNINFLKESKDVLFVSIYKDLFFFDTQTGRFEPILRQDQTSNMTSPNYIDTPFKDQQGNYWMATAGSGVYLARKTESPFTFYQNSTDDKGSVSIGQVRTFVEDSLGNLWVGILNHGLDQFTYEANNRLQKKKSIVSEFERSNSLRSNRFVKIIQGTDNTFWLATLTHGVAKMDFTGKQFEFFEHDPNDPTSLSENRVWALTEDREGYIWAGAWRNGLNRIDPKTSSIEKFRHDPNDTNSLIHDNIRTLYTDSEGIIWIGTDDGLSSYDSKTNNFTNYRHVPNEGSSLSDKTVWALYEDRKGDMWVGTNAGLNRLDKGTKVFERFYEKNGLPDNTILWHFGR